MPKDRKQRAAWAALRGEFAAKAIELGVHPALTRKYMKRTREGVEHESRTNAGANHQDLYFKRIRATYGLHKATFLRMLANQDSRCRGCGRQLVLFSSDRAEIPVVDHHHKTGRVRALVCTGCNVRIGRVEFSAEHEKYDEARQYVAAFEASGEPSSPGGDGP